MGYYFGLGILIIFAIIVAIIVLHQDRRDKHFHKSHQ